jgi:hypothetical protein
VNIFTLIKSSNDETRSNETAGIVAAFVIEAAESLELSPKKSWLLYWSSRPLHWKVVVQPAISASTFYGKCNIFKTMTSFLKCSAS